MYIKLLGKNPPKLESIKGKCLDKIEDVDYIDVMNEDEYADKSFCIYDDFNQEIGYVEACLAREKAGIQIIRMKTKFFEIH